MMFCLEDGNSLSMHLQSSSYKLHFNECTNHTMIFAHKWHCCKKSLTTVTALFENMQGGGGSVKIHFTIM